MWILGLKGLKKTVCPNGQSKRLVTQLTAELKSCPDSSVDIVFSIEVISTPGHACTFKMYINLMYDSLFNCFYSNFWFIWKEDKHLICNITK